MMGLCPGCLLGLVNEDADESDGDAVDEASVVANGGSRGGGNGPVVVDPELQETLFMHQQEATIHAGQLLGDRYQIRALLGRGGMGEV
jgi:hypothetical protein